MTNDELHALADALSRQRQADEHGIYCAVPRQAVDAAIKYLRAQAEAQPAAWQFKIRVWIGGDLFEERDHVSREWREGAVPLYLHPAPAAPQAEPKREPLSDERIELPDYLRLQIAGTAAAHDVLVERRRQIEVEGWTPEHDDEHSLGEMAALAAFYAVPDGVHEWDFSSTGYGVTLAEALLPSGWTAKAGKDRRRDLVKAGALILAEIERLDRMGGQHD